MRPSCEHFQRYIDTDLPGRLDALPFSLYHFYLICALGVSWVLDGIEVSIGAIVGPILQDQRTLGISHFDIGLLGSLYIVGTVTGSLFFGRLTDLYGRRKLYLVTPSVYIIGTALCAVAPSFRYLAAARMLTGFGIGGEYAAINSIVQEIVPAANRGAATLAVNCSFWLGSIIASAATIYLLDCHVIPLHLGWRVCFAIGAALGVIVIVLRLPIPESPRWLLQHGHADRAEAVVAGIERRALGRRASPPLSPLDASPLARPSYSTSRPPKDSAGRRRAVVSGGRAATPPSATDTVNSPLLTTPTLSPQVTRIYVTGAASWGDIAGIIATYWQRAVLGTVLMVAQAFFYNAIYFTYADTLKSFFGVRADTVGLYGVPFALANLCGAVLAPLFDTVGRRRMIAATYITAACLLLGAGYVFVMDKVDGVGMTAVWAFAFFFASPAASSGYLVVSEVFPLEIRGMAIAIFFSVGTAVGGISGPLLFGRLISLASPDTIPDPPLCPDIGLPTVTAVPGPTDTPTAHPQAREFVFYGYLVAAGLMLAAGAVAAVLGVDAEGKSLESLTLQDAPEGDGEGANIVH